MPAIKTASIYPPIPIRSFDWQATLGDYDEGDTVGYGATEAEAIADLREQLPSCDDCGAITTDDGISVDERCCHFCKGD